MCAPRELIPTPSVDGVSPPPYDAGHLFLSTRMLKSGSTIGGLQIGESLGATSRLELYTATSAEGPRLVGLIIGEIVDAAALARHVDLWSDDPAMRRLGLPSRIIRTSEQTLVVSEATSGISWREAVKGSPPADGVRLVGRLVDNVARLHRVGVIHGEIDPTSVRVDTEGGVAVAMPGLASHIRPIRGEGPWWEPELSLGAPPCASSDVYALGLAAALVDGADVAPVGRRERRSVARGRTTAPRFGPTGAGWSPEMVSAVNLALAARVDRPTNAAVFRALLRLQPVRPAQSTPADLGVVEQTRAADVSVPKRTLRRRLGARIRASRRFAAAGGLVAAVVLIGQWWMTRPYHPTCRSAEDCAVGLACQAGLCAVDGMVFVPPGRFDGGAIEGPSVGRDEPYTAELSYGFYIDQTEITQGEFEALTSARPSWFSECGDDCPVESVNWFEAIEFANLRSEEEGLPTCYRAHACTGEFGMGCPDMEAGDPGHNCVGEYSCRRVEFAGVSCAGYRLPTEVEWEYAARGGTRTSTYAGTLEFGTRSAEELEMLRAIARTAESSEVDYPAWPCSEIEGMNQNDQCGPGQVASLEPNAYGVYDMLGNVGEWTGDRALDAVGRQTGWRCLGRGEIGQSGDRTCRVRRVRDRAVHNDEASGRILRGGAFFHSAPHSSASVRNMLRWRRRFVDVGFRLVRTAVRPATG